MSMNNLNIELFKAINGFGREHSYLDQMVIFLAEYTIYLLIISLLIYWFTKKPGNRRLVISSFISILIAELLGKAIGSIYAHNQPFAVLSGVNQLIEKEVGNSFPSDHTITFFPYVYQSHLSKINTGLCGYY